MLKTLIVINLADIFYEEIRNTAFVINYAINFWFYPTVSSFIRFKFVNLDILTCLSVIIK